MTEENTPIYSILDIEGDKYQTLLTKKYLNRKKYIAPDPKQIKAVIPGTVVKVLVRKGRKIEVGESLIIFEAMKMQTHVQANVDGKIKAIHVKKGQMVSKNYVMIELV